MARDLPDLSAPMPTTIPEARARVATAEAEGREAIAALAAAEAVRRAAAGDATAQARGEALVAAWGHMAAACTARTQAARALLAALEQYAAGLCHQLREAEARARQAEALGLMEHAATAQRQGAYFRAQLARLEGTDSGTE